MAKTFSMSQKKVKSRKTASSKAKKTKTKKSKVVDKELLSLANNVGITNLNFKDKNINMDWIKDKKWNNNLNLGDKHNFEFSKDVGNDKMFHSSCGSKFNNLLDLAKAIRHMKEEHFVHHVNDKKNDFAKWIKDCMGEKTLANDLAKYKTKSSNELLILRHITNELKSSK